MPASLLQTPPTLVFWPDQLIEEFLRNLDSELVIKREKFLSA